MNEEQVVELMKSSKNEDEWEENVDKVRRACNGYPAFWFELIIKSGLAEEVASRWGGDAEIEIITL